MTPAFTARIDGDLIRCTITAGQPLAAPTLCFSLMAAPRVVSGGELTRQLAGYAEVRLPDLAAGVAHDLVLAHADPGFRPVNRAWLPLGAYLRHAGGCLPLPPLPAGVRDLPGAAPAPAAVGEGAPLLVPPPLRSDLDGTALPFTTFRSDHPALRAADALARRLSLGALLSDDGAPLAVEEDPALPAEGYRLLLADAPAITGHPDGGVFHAAISALMLRALHGALPRGRIEDAPRFGWRGQHLDCARHFFCVDTILRLLDLMALVKLNRFHWHFADDEAFRLEVACAPDLARRTAWRGEGALVPGVFGGGIRSGGSYGPADVARVLARAAELHIEVLPEIEVPAHAHALNLAVPGLRDPADTGAEISIQGYPRNIVNPALDATWDLLEPLAREVAGMFPLGILHLGCDELPPAAWAGSPAARALMEREGLATRDDLQGWMMSRLGACLQHHGIRPAAWEEAAKGAQGGIGNDALLFSWTGQGPGIAAARAGHDVVMCPAQHVYLDMAHTADPADWGAAWAAFVSLEDTVNWSPVPPGAEDVAHRIAGVEGCFWAEFTTEDRQMEPMLAPRILGLACKAWEEDGRTDGPALRAMATAWAPVFDRIGWRRHSGA